MNFNEIRGNIQLVRNDISPILLSQIFCEALLYPFLVLFWAGWNRYSKHLPLPAIKKAVRKIGEKDQAVICLHDWLGYPGERNKTLKNGIKFSCGRAKILREIQERKNKIPSEILVSLSGSGKYDFNFKSIKKVIKTENRGKDFRGYSSMLQEIIKAPGNPFVVLMNSSLAGGFYDGWLDDYCSILTNDRSIGLLGVSTRARFPGLIKNHLVPHLQSYFLFSTKEVLSKILHLNGGMLPGSTERNKFRLIQKGEIGLSQQILKFGFAIAAVYQGNVLKFRLRNRFSNNISQWPFPLEDIRLTSAGEQIPNLITRPKSSYFI
jgi:hypothetical protein